MHFQETNDQLAKWTGHNQLSSFHCLATMEMLICYCRIPLMLLPTQITIVNPIHKHSNNFFEIKDSGTPAEMWKAYSKQQIKVVSFVWVGNNTNLDDKMDGHFIVTLDKFDGGCFLLLAKLNLS